MVNGGIHITFDEYSVNEVYAYVSRTVTKCDWDHDDHCTSTSVDNSPSYRVLAQLLQSATGKLSTIADTRTHLENIGASGMDQISDAQIRRVMRCHEEMFMKPTVQSQLGTTGQNKVEDIAISDGAQFLADQEQASTISNVISGSQCGGEQSFDTIVAQVPLTDPTYP